MRRLDYLPNTNIYLYQEDDMFRINSDTCALGEFIELKKDDIVLDVGTNNGALLLYANKKGCNKLIGIDITDKAIEVCRANMELNNIENYELHVCRFQDLAIDKVDIIICNPPYFKNCLVNENEYLKNARHEGSLSMEELVYNSHRLLKNGGKLMVVYKTTELANFIVILNKYGFGVTRLKLVFDENKNFSNCFLIEAIKNRKNDVKAEKPLIITR